MSGLAADPASLDFHQLVQAYVACRKHKRSSASCQAYEAQLERNLWALYSSLKAGTWQPGRSTCFVVTLPRPREVWAAPFEDRIVHHALYNAIAPRFLASFIADSCACLPERGTLYAARRLERHVRSATQGWQRPVYYLKLDLRNFFVSIPKRVLFEQIAARVHEPFWLWLAETILFHDPRADVEVKGRASDIALVPPHKSLFNAPPDTGLPIGNLSSQFFANIFLDALDQFVKHKIGAKHYVRYVDDFVLVHESAAWLNDAHGRIAGFLAERLGMQINERKTILQPASRGIDFVGQVIRPHHRTTRARTLRVALHRLETMPAEQLHASGNSYLGLVRQSGTSHHEQALVCRALMKRGHTVNGALTKAYRRAA